ncbi:hypothetical protein AB0G98_21600 [Streptomyces sp. NPDC020196]|uniref:hypothetical protein n=1 Tax=Streptomyces sp. NPDC020196 TaxID=3156656 RepID=UPI0033EE10DB
MTTQPDRIPLDDLTSDQLDQLYDRLDVLENGARERSALLEEARDALENAGALGAHGNDWPRLVPAIEALAADRDRYEEVVGEMNEKAIDLTRRIAELETAAAPEVDRRSLHARHVAALTDAYPDLRHTADHIANLILGVRDEHVRELEQRVAELTAGQCTHQPTP